MENANEREAAGLAIRREVLGAEYVDRALAGVTDFNRDFQQMVNEYCWGGPWSRDGLDRRTRSILNLGMLAALGRAREFELHTRGALTNGVTVDELREVLLQIAVYCGIPAGVEAFRLAGPIVDEWRKQHP